MSIEPPSARTRVAATSIPTPRPETLVTASAVENPGRASTRSSWSSDSASACASTTPSRRARSRILARSMPRPSSETVMATLARSRTAASTISPSGGLPWRRRSAGASMPWSTALRSRWSSGSPSSSRMARSSSISLPSTRDAPRLAHRALDLGRRRRRVEPEAEAAVEVLRLERRGGGCDAVHRPQRLRLLEDEQRTPALERRLAAQRHLYQPPGGARCDRGGSRLAHRRSILYGYGAAAVSPPPPPPPPPPPGGGPGPGPGHLRPRHPRPPPPPPHPPPPPPPAPPPEQEPPQ